MQVRAKEKQWFEEKMHCSFVPSHLGRESRRISYSMLLFFIEMMRYCRSHLMARATSHTITALGRVASLTCRGTPST